jgi:hypothetical protein
MQLCAMLADANLHWIAGLPPMRRVLQQISELVAGQLGRSLSLPREIAEEDRVPSFD